MPETLPQYEHVEGLPLGTRGGLLARYTFPHTGEYEIAVDLLCRIQGECDGSVGFPDTHELEVAIDGERVEALHARAAEGVQAAGRAHLAAFACRWTPVRTM